jgi:hypothetical protein
VAVLPFLAQQEADAVLDALLRDTLRLMRERAGSQYNPAALVHVVTGALRDSFRIAGPFNVGRGTLEGAIRPGVPYAIDEIERGGSHDYAARTLTATAGMRAEAAEDLARRVARIAEEG